jgi:hypothetical protein
MKILDNKQQNKRPFFSKEKFFKALPEGERGRVLLRVLENNRAWFDILDGQELQLIEEKYHSLNKEFNRYMVDEEWIEWR